MRRVAALGCLAFAVAVAQEPVIVVSVSQGTLKPKLKVTPMYPRSAKARGLRGNVVIQVMIGTNGKVQKMELRQGHRELGIAAMDAIRYWRYEPYLLDGKAVRVETLIVVGFK